MSKTESLKMICDTVVRLTQEKLKDTPVLDVANFAPELLKKMLGEVAAVELEVKHATRHYPWINPEDESYLARLRSEGKIICTHESVKSIEMDDAGNLFQCDICGIKFARFKDADPCVMPDEEDAYLKTLYVEGNPTDGYEMEIPPWQENEFKLSCPGFIGTEKYGSRIPRRGEIGCVEGVTLFTRFNAPTIPETGGSLLKTLRKIKASKL